MEMLSLPLEDNVFRLVHFSNRARKAGKEPTEGAFTPSTIDNYKLSVDHDRLTTPEESLARFGATYRPSGEFKNHREFTIYAINVGFLKSLSSIIDVYPAPTFVNPPEKGKPDNPAHSLVHFKDTAGEDDPEIYYKIQSHAKERRIPADLEKVDKLVEVYRKQWD